MNTRVALGARRLLRTHVDYESFTTANRWRQFRRTEIPFASHLHTYADRLSLQERQSREEDEKRRLGALPTVSTLSIARYHSSVPTERAVAIILGLGAVSAGSYAASTAVKAYREWQASLPEEPLEEEVEDSDEKEQKQETSEKKREETPEGSRENVFAKWFGVGVGSKYYEGGFEEKMTRREAALILGVRESSSARRIKEAHRKLLILNHPDTGGSTYMAGKINEAKELLLKGRRDK